MGDIVAAEELKKVLENNDWLLAPTVKNEGGAITAKKYLINDVISDCAIDETIANYLTEFDSEHGINGVDLIGNYELISYEWYCANFPNEIVIPERDVAEIVERCGDDEDKIKEELQELAEEMANDKLYDFSRELHAPYKDFCDQLTDYPDDDEMESKYIKWRNKNGIGGAI